MQTKLYTGVNSAFGVSYKCVLTVERLAICISGVMSSLMLETESCIMLRISNHYCLGIQ